MSRQRFFVSNAIPYVNGDPHLGHALEFVQADVLARHRRARGDDVRYLSGTDDNSLKNVEAADAAGVPVRDFVDAKAGRFADLRGPLQLSYDDFIRTSVDPRHRAGVERLWSACAAAGDLYERDYEGLYCAGCEEFVDGACGEHAAPPESVRERNWFFRLSRYEAALLRLIESGSLRVEPAHRRNEVLSFVRGGLADFSVSRPVERARGWGIPVPGDASQAIYVWFDALANYLTADPAWWRSADERVHVVGKGIVRFHAVYWPAILLSAREPLPTAVFVHDYLTVEGAKISKSSGNAFGPAGIAARYGADALRWWLLRDVPRSGDTDFRDELLAARANELANDLGNLVNRTIALVARHGHGGAPAHVLDGGRALEAALQAVGPAIDASLDRFDYRAAAGALWEVVGAANRLVSSARPWEPAAAESRDAVLALLLRAVRTVTSELRPFLPAAAARIGDALERGDAAAGRTLFPKVHPNRGLNSAERSS